MKKYLASAVAVITMFVSSFSVFADEIKVTRDIENEKFTVFGNASAQSVVRVIVVAPEKEYSDAVGALKPFDIIKYQKEIDVSDEGEYAFAVEISDVSGVYTAYIATESGVKQAELEYVNPDNYSLVVSGLNQAEDVESYIEDNRNDLGFFLKLYDNVDKGEVCEKIEKALPLTGKIAEECIAVFNSAVIATAIEENDIEGISDYKDKIYMLCDGGVADKWYQKVNADMVDKRISGSFETVEAFESAVREAIVLTVIEKPDGYLNVKNVIAAFKDEIGITSPTSKDDIYKKLAGKSFATYEDLKDNYKELLGSSSNSGGGGSGGGGGGGSSSKPNKIEDVFPGISSEQIPVQKPEPPIVKEYFLDMDKAEWAKVACESLAEKGILTGKSEGVFAPLDSITREEFVAIITRAFGIKKVVNENAFSDVFVNDWCYDYVLAASQNNIIGGIGEGLFGKGQNITRQDMATILYRVITEKNIATSDVVTNINFTDEASISDYAKEAVKYLSSRGIINGMGNGTFSGGENASRAQAAQMIYNLLDIMEV